MTGGVPHLPAEALAQIAMHIGFDPVVSENPIRHLSLLPESKQRAWLSAHEDAVMDAVSLAGGNKVANFFRGHGLPYEMIVRQLARKMGIPAENDSVPMVERRIVTTLWQKAHQQLTVGQIQQLEHLAQEEARRLGRRFNGELFAAGALSAAQLSGFGIYMLGTTVLGALNGALGLSLGFGAFTALSSTIATIIGPIGWTGLGLAVFVKLASPNYKRLLPVVVIIASYRGLESRDHKGWSLLTPIMLVIGLVVLVLLAWGSLR